MLTVCEAFSDDLDVATLYADELICIMVSKLNVGVIHKIYP